MEEICVEKVNHTCIRVYADRSILYDLHDTMSFYAEGYKFMPKYRNGMWDGKIRLFNLQTGTLPAGLYPELEKFAVSNGYNIVVHEDSEYELQENHDLKYNLDIPLTSADNKLIELYDHQQIAIDHIIQKRRGVIISSTGSGKSLIAYCLARYFEDETFLIVVPTTSLVEQLYTDFGDYCQQDDSFEVTPDTVHRIYSGKEKVRPEGCRIVISTWQSIYKFPRSWFEDYTAVIGDEAHTFKAKCLTAIMDKSTNASIRCGLTGTLDGSTVHELQLRGLFSDVFVASRTKDLQDKNILAAIKINCITLEHKDKAAQVPYQQEMKYLVGHAKRNDFIVKLALSQKRNTLILFNYVSTHGKPLYKLVQEMNTDPDRPIYFIAGEIDTMERETIRKLMETHEKDQKN